jgi:hypothetical protein
MVPPGGWHYIDGDVKLTAYSYDNLIKTVENYRAENNLPQGDVVGDVNSFICTNWPNTCHGVDMVVITSVNAPTQATDLLADIQVWAKNILHSNKPLMLVHDEVAETRARVCRACPENINWRAGCTSCITAADRLCASIRQGRDTPSSQVLGGCRLMRHDNRTAIFFDKDQIMKSESVPNNCWCK